MNLHIDYIDIKVITSFGCAKANVKVWDPLAHLVEYRSSDREVQGSGLGRVGGGFHMYS